MKVDITFTKVLPWILLVLSILGNVWTLGVMNSNLTYLMDRDKEERNYLLNRMNTEYLQVMPAIRDSAIVKDSTNTN